jgi:hypothetical protein
MPVEAVSSGRVSSRRPSSHKRRQAVAGFAASSRPFTSKAILILGRALISLAVAYQAVGWRLAYQGDQP